MTAMPTQKMVSFLIFDFSLEKVENRFLLGFFIQKFLLIGTNTTTLPTWTMNDLLQINGNDTKVNTVNQTVASPIKRTSLRSRTQQQHQMSETTNGSQIQNHKRPSPLDSSINKRLKSNSTVSSFNLNNTSSSSIGNIQQQSFSLQNADTVHQHQKSPHLLQHLMAPSPDRLRKYNGPANKIVTGKSSTDTQWDCNVDFDDTKTQSSDSVLKNLLVSGCDISAGYVCHVPVRLRKLTKA